MAEVAFDTLSMARTLERDYDFNPKQAEGAATMFHRHLVGNVATKEDIARVQEDIVRVEQNMAANMATKVDLAEVRTGIAQVESSIKTEIADVRTELRTEIAEVRTEIARSSNRQIYVLGGLIGGLFAIDKILPLFGV